MFILDEDITLNAMYHCDKHIVKMPLELVQMACLNIWYCNGIAPYYKPNIKHLHHPCTKWMRESEQNYEWSMKFGQALFEEYTHRYRKTHSSEEVLYWAKKVNLQLPDKGLTPFPKAMGEMPKHLIVDDVVESYRRYYAVCKRNFAKWKYTSEPEWFAKYVNNYS